MAEWNVAMAVSADRPMLMWDVREKAGTDSDSSSVTAVVSQGTSYYWTSCNGVKECLCTKWPPRLWNAATHLKAHAKRTDVKC